jgi:hypothetical protein
MISVSENSLAEPEILFYKIIVVPSQDWVFVSTLAILFFMKHSWTNSLYLSFSFEWRIVVSILEKSNG